jgi:hypothetical protein
MRGLPLLLLWTALHSSANPSGFEDRLKICFYKRDGSEAHCLPSARTCSLILWLPRDVDDPDSIWKMLLDAITLCAGSGSVKNTAYAVLIEVQLASFIVLVMWHEMDVIAIYSKIYHYLMYYETCAYFRVL